MRSATCPQTKAAVEEEEEEGEEEELEEEEEGASEEGGEEEEEEAPKPKKKVTGEQPACMNPCGARCCRCVSKSVYIAYSLARAPRSPQAAAKPRSKKAAAPKKAPAAKKTTAKKPRAAPKKAPAAKKAAAPKKAPAAKKVGGQVGVGRTAWRASSTRRRRLSSQAPAPPLDASVCCAS